MPLSIVQPLPNTSFAINATPAMPVIACIARITGVNPDPTPNTIFTWSIAITEAVVAKSCSSSKVGNCTLSVQNAIRGGAWTPAFNTIQGGDALITVTAVQGTTTLRASVRIKIVGTNPSTSAITQRLGGSGSIGDRIACKESNRMQFSRTTGMPLEGAGGDVGVMQLCNPSAVCLQRWSWTANVDAGIALLGIKRNDAINYLNVNKLNGRYPNSLGLNDNEVLLRETIQRYNGGAYWRWNNTTRQWVPNPPNNYVADVLRC